MTAFIELGFPQKILLNELQSLEDFNSVKSVLEIGCGIGTNLFHLAKAYPQMKISGFDIDAQRILLAQTVLKRFNNVNVFVEDARLMSTLKRYDLVFTSAVLMLISSKDIQEVINKIEKISNNYIIFIEYQSDSHVKEELLVPDTLKFQYLRTKLSRFFLLPQMLENKYHYWKRDYEQFISKDFEIIHKRKITKSMWSGNWVRHGYVMTFKKVKSSVRG